MVCCCFTVCARRRSFSLRAKQNLFLKSWRILFSPLFAVFPSSFTPQLSLVGKFACQLGNTGSLLPICSMSCSPGTVTSGNSLSQELQSLRQPAMREMNSPCLRFRTGQLLHLSGCQEGWKDYLALETLATKWRRGNFPCENLFCFIIVF